MGIYCDFEPGLAGVTPAGGAFARSLGNRGAPPPLDAVREAFRQACEAAARG